MSRSPDSYARQLTALLPPGAVWNLQATSLLSAFMTALAQELARVDMTGDALIDETDPRTISQTLPEWEAMLGLPDPCVSFDQSTAQRLAGVLSKYVSTGGQTAQYFIEVAAALGFIITITEFTPFTVGDTVDKDIKGVFWNYAWQVNAPQQSVNWFDVTDSVDDPLSWWSNQILECVLNRLKPAHTAVLFSYT